MVIVKVILGLAVAGVIYSTAVLAWLLQPGTSPVANPVWVTAFVAGFVVLGSALVVAKSGSATRSSHGRWGLKRPDRIAGAATISLVAVFVSVLVLTVTDPLPPVPPGQPQIVNGLYAVNNHGALTYVPYQVYRNALKEMQLLFVGGSLISYLAAALALGIGASRTTPRRYRLRSSR